MIIRTAQFATGQSGFARMFKLNKYGIGNTVGENLPSTINHILQLRLMGAGNTTAESCTLHLKNYTIAGNPYITFTTSAPIMKSLEVYVEETSSHFILIVKHRLNGSSVTIEVEDSGYLDTFMNDTFTYTPTGKLVKPQSFNVMLTGSSGATANQWAKIATIKINSTTTNYSALLSMHEADAIQVTSSIRLFSVQIRQSNLNELPRVNVAEISSPLENRFEVYSIASFNATDSTVELWVKLLSANSIIAYQILSEVFSDESKTVSAQYHATPIPSVSQPSGTLVQAKGNKRNALTLQNGWTAAGGYDNTISQNGNLVVLNFGVTGGTAASGTDIALIDAALAPKGSLFAPCVLEDSGGVRSTGYVAVFSSGKVQIRGALPHSNLLAGSFTYAI